MIFDDVAMRGWYPHRTSFHVSMSALDTPTKGFCKLTRRLCGIGRRSLGAREGPLDDSRLSPYSEASQELFCNRWTNVLSLSPAFIEILTWNDYGESHYIGLLNSPHTDDGASKWVNDM